ncbi:MAG: DNA (cytosine-5-)-methyltransferase [Desulfotalea sp.]|nr:MAG: DNA (cytosine-5-)-methyltransferase [Desulfotalea sp.]
MNQIKQQNITAVDLFAGAGGFSLGASNIGINLLAAVELDTDACDTYRTNISDQSTPATKVFNQDILTLCPESFRKDLGLETGDLDCLIGGPPCQGFSGHRLKDEGVDDPRNKLLLRYFDFVRELKPKFFLVENVPGLLWKKHELYLQRFKNLSRRNGYKLFTPEKINAKDYGIPQNRLRVFILGVRTDQDTRDLSWPPPVTHFDPKLDKQSWVPASSVFSKAPKYVLKKMNTILGKDETANLPFTSRVAALKDDPSAVHMIHTTALTERFKNTPINGSREDIAFRLPCHAKDYKGHKDVYGRVRLGQPGPTMTTGCSNPSKGRFLHPWKNHGISIRHAARFQTFPEDFVFSGGMTSQSKQVGNAVPVKLAEVILLEVITGLATKETDTIKRSAVAV